MAEPASSLMVIGLMVGLAMQTVEAVPLTFEQRWAPTQQIIPPIRLKEQDLIDHVKRRQLPDPVPEIKVRTIPIRMDPPPIVEMKGEGPQGDAVPMPRERPPARAKLIRKASLDVCQRHNMRKVHYGRTWRCRR